MTMPHDLVYLEWIDSASGDGWQHIEGYEHGPIFVCSVGWVQHEDDTILTIASNMGRQSSDGTPNQACGWMSIPKAAIQVRRTLRKR